MAGTDRPNCVSIVQVYLLSATYRMPIIQDKKLDFLNAAPSNVRPLSSLLPMHFGLVLQMRGVYRKLVVSIEPRNAMQKLSTLVKPPMHTIKLKNGPWPPDTHDWPGSSIEPSRSSAKNAELKNRLQTRSSKFARSSMSKPKKSSE